MYYIVRKKRANIVTNSQRNIIICWWKTHTFNTNVLFLFFSSFGTSNK